MISLQGLSEKNLKFVWGHLVLNTFEWRHLILYTFVLTNPTMGSISAMTKLLALMNGILPKNNNKKLIMISQHTDPAVEAEWLAWQSSKTAILCRPRYDTVADIID